MKMHVGEPPEFVEELVSPFMIVVDQMNQLLNLNEIIEYKSPLITDLEQDTIALQFTVPEQLEAVTVSFEGDHFVCKIDTALVIEENAGAHEIQIHMLDDGAAPKEVSTISWILQIDYLGASLDMSELSEEEAADL